MLMKTLVIIAFFAVLYCLASALYFLAKEGSNSVHMARALTWRISLSIALFIFLMLAFWMGWMVPHGLIIV